MSDKKPKLRILLDTPHNIYHRDYYKKNKDKISDYRKKIYKQMVHDRKFKIRFNI